MFQKSIDLKRLTLTIQFVISQELFACREVLMRNCGFIDDQAFSLALMVDMGTLSYHLAGERYHQSHPQTPLSYCPVCLGAQQSHIGKRTNSLRKMGRSNVIATTAVERSQSCDCQFHRTMRVAPPAIKHVRNNFKYNISSYIHNYTIGVMQIA